MTSDDRRCYSYFQFYVAPEIASFTLAVWRKLVLQMTETEPAVLHAVIGFSALSQSVSAACKAQKHAISLKYDPWRQFGLEQLGRSFALLSRRHSSHDPQLVQVTLLCCLIFIVCDLLQHQYNHAFNHLQNGIQILSELGYGRALMPQVSIEEELPVLWLPKEKSATHPSSKCSSQGLRLTFESLRSSVFKFTTDLVFLPEGQSATQYEAEYFTLLERGNQSIKEVDSHYARVYPQLSQEERKRADLMRIHTSGEGLVLKCCFPTGTLEPHAEHFRSHLSLIESFMHRFPERPGITMGEAVLPGLVLVAFRAPDLDVRWRAIDMLLAWPHLEGPWDSRAIARRAIENIKEYVPGCVEMGTVRGQSFEIDGPLGSQYCIAFKPQGNIVHTLQETFPKVQLHKFLVKSIIHCLFFAVNWLLATCGVTHTEILASNVLMDIEDDSIHKIVEQKKIENPSTPITTGTGTAATTVYKARPTMLELSGHPWLTYFSQMRVVEGCIN
ncbi:hypothetical protein BDV40DRAFT_297038 [Aspergillus tamarii]|uniref:Protein kinase domain-containing protein n=1 Tax=Aspergillus tamarii TaxID=41984 RepID=A0A5N6V7N6_ASPTM|nr:hypothetical protein BDV40DRAFT_297038 [Aspergillus tamarii]